MAGSTAFPAAEASLQASRMTPSKDGPAACDPPQRHTQAASSGLRPARRSFSDSRGKSSPRTADVGDKSHARPHQRTLSATQGMSAGNATWPARRLTSVLRVGLRKGPGMRARATTDISTDYVSVSMAASSPGPSQASAPTSIGSDGCGTRTPPPAGPLAGPPTSRADSGSSGPGVFRPRKRSLSVGGENSCHDFFARQIEQYGLQSLLTSPVATCYFLASAISNYSPESLLFFLEAEHYRTANFSDSARRTRYAKGLYKAFISHRSPLELNISHGTRTRITSAFRTAEPATAAMFQETQAQARALLEQDYASFRQRPLYGRMMADLASPPTSRSSPSRKDTRAQRVRAVTAVYDALAATYGIDSLSPSKARLVESEAPLFIKFADMDLTSTELHIALPAWLCRTTVRLLDTPMPTSREELARVQRRACDAPGPVSSEAPPASAPASQVPPRELLVDSPVLGAEALSAPPTARPGLDSPPGCHDRTAKKAGKKKSLQRLRFRLQPDSGTTEPAPSTSSPLSAPIKSRWESLWTSRRRKQ
ncbi:hypothetical protein GGF46_002772 [Coemansia sp. RSA 552]|nr:hypothetical protein GGF46_002772 [Coemansia sp. RSA 552]